MRAVVRWCAVLMGLILSVPAWPSPASAKGKPAPAAATPTPIAPMEKPTPPPATPVQMVHFRSKGGIQFDVWLDGKRQGMTPVNVVLPPGPYLMTAFAPDYRPVLESLVITDKPNQTIEFAERELTSKNFGAVFEQIVKTQNEHPENPHLLLVGALLATEKTDFEGLFVRLPAENQKDPMLALARARWAAVTGNMDTAVEVLNEGIALDRRIAALWRARSQIHLHQGDAAGAEDTASEAARLEPKNFRNYLTRARARAKLGKTAEADSDFKRVLEMDPTNREARAARGLSKPPAGKNGASAS